MSKSGMCGGETCNCSGGGFGQVYVCVVPPLREGTGPAAICCWSGRSSAAGAAQCPDVPSSRPAVPTAQLPRPRLSFLGRGGRGTLLRLFLGSLQTEQGCEIVMFHVEVLDLGEN